MAEEIKPINQVLSELETKEGKLANNKVANFAYEDEAFEKDWADGVTEYDYNEANNIPVANKEILEVNETVLTKGFRSQASSLTRMFANHFFGRVSYNLNKTVDVLNKLIAQFKGNLGNPNGLATLDSNGRIPYSQLPETAIEFKGTWNATTNTTSVAFISGGESFTSLKNGRGVKGDIWLCNTAGWFDPVPETGSATEVTGYIQFFANDRIIYDGTNWNRLSSGDIQQVNGLYPTNGNVQLTIRLTQAQYNQLTSQEKKGKFFVITDMEGRDMYVINDNVTADDTTWSSNKIVSNLASALTEYEYKFAAGITMENLDLDTYTTIGFYQSKANIGYTNAPSGGRDANFNLRVEYVLVDHYIIQTLQSYIDGKIFTRGTYYSSGGIAWSSWEEVVTKSELNGALEQKGMIKIYSFNPDTNEISLIQDGTDSEYSLFIIAGNYSTGWNTSVKGVGGITALQNRFGDISNCLCLAKKINFYLDIQGK